MVEYIRSTFDERIKSNSWMDQPTKDQAMKKVNSITSYFIIMKLTFIFTLSETNTYLVSCIKPTFEPQKVFHPLLVGITSGGYTLFLFSLLDFRNDLSYYHKPSRTGEF